MKKFIAVLLVLISTSVFGDCSSLVFNGKYPLVINIEPDSSLLCRKMYVLEHSAFKKTPYWSAEHILGKNMGIPKERKNAFKADPDLRKGAKAYPYDYSRTGFDRGHMSPVGDMHIDDKAMLESFYMSNMVPQHPFHNRAFWKTFENTVREYAVKHGELYVITGPIYTKSPVKTIGKNRVAVPDFLYKIVYNPKNNTVLSMLSPNKNDINIQDMPDYISTLSNVETMAGIKFFPGTDIPPTDKTLFDF